MNYFSIKDIVTLSGIKAHTFRIWEQRHGLRFCKRKESQHRYYDNDDLKAVLRISYLYHKGYKISKIAKFSKDEIINLTTLDFDHGNYDTYVHQLIEAGIEYDQPKMEKIVQYAILLCGMEKAMIQVFYPFFQKIGLLWVTEHLIPAQEHFSTAIIQQKLLVAIERLGPLVTNRKETVLIFSPEKEYHELPLLLGSYLLKKNGIKTVYFGADVSADQLEYYINHRKISHLYFHLITNFQHADAGEYINFLARRFPRVSIIGSGPALAGVTATASTVRIIESVEELIPSIIYEQSF